jgi:predicted 3-demethylubiquinone-9 3-methyltransferase (glyoxalase superfamily)
MIEPRITPFLWFDGQAEDAAKFYTSIFKDAKIVDVSRYGDGGPFPKDTAMMVVFQLDGQKFMALNAGPEFKFTEAISFFVRCEDQAEVDYYWDRLIQGGEESRCGWLKDKFGLSWQVVPTILRDLLGDDDEEKSGRAMQAMLTMSKLDIAALQKAFDGPLRV